MADTAKATATATVDGTTHKTRPEKPDEAKYKADLAKSEKEHAVAQEKEVCRPLSTVHSPFLAEHHEFRSRY